MLEIIAKEIDKDGSSDSDISSVMHDMAIHNLSCESAPQQIANGTYRAVEMLEVIAKEIDWKDTYSEEISDVMTSLSLHNLSCDSAPKQGANGSYRMVECLVLSPTYSINGLFCIERRKICRI